MMNTIHNLNVLCMPANVVYAAATCEYPLSSCELWRLRGGLWVAARGAVGIPEKLAWNVDVRQEVEV